MWFTDAVKFFFRKADMVLLSLCLVASFFGLVLIYSATRYDPALHSSVYKQMIAIALGILAYFVMSFVDIELFTERSWKWLLLFGMTMILALIPFGVAGDSGNKSWIPLPLVPFNIQPAEVVKISFVMLLSWQCVKLQEWGISRFSSVLQLAGHTLFMCALIGVISQDFGMVLVYLSLFVIIAWTAGVQKRWFLLGALSAGGAIFLIWSHIPPYIQMRFKVIFDHSLDPQNKGWQQARSILAIGSGGLSGQGYLQGIQTQSASSSALIARNTDEIFAVCGEEFGMIGCVLLMLLLATIILRCVWVSRRAKSPMSAYLAMGFGGMLLVQTVFNIGMCLYVFPVVGLTLPFISYGGSSIITLFTAMGIVSGVKMRSLPSWLKDRSQL